MIHAAIMDIYIYTYSPDFKKWLKTRIEYLTAFESFVSFFNCKDMIRGVNESRYSNLIRKILEFDLELIEMSSPYFKKMVENSY